MLLLFFNLLWSLFEKWTDSKSSFSKTIFPVKIVFEKDDFWLLQKTTFTCFLNLRKIWTKTILNQKSSFSKTIFTGKIIFEKDDFELIHFSNKLQKSYVWPKKKKKISKFGLKNGSGVIFWVLKFLFTRPPPIPLVLQLHVFHERSQSIVSLNPS